MDLRRLRQRCEARLRALELPTPFDVRAFCEQLALYRASPEIALLPPPSRLAETLAVRRLGLRLYRRVVEIRDGSVALRPYVDPVVAERARALCVTAGVPLAETQAVVEAACLAAAVDAKRHGRPPNPTPPRFAMAGGADLGAEVVLLERVAGCFQHSSLVRAALAAPHPARPDATPRARHAV